MLGESEYIVTSPNSDPTSCVIALPRFRRFFTYIVPGFRLRQAILMLTSQATDGLSARRVPAFEASCGYTR
ncbi:MAG: hypothetical protein ACYC55_06220 [Candidatus Geothermincolia bacterium]